MMAYTLEGVQKGNSSAVNISCTGIEVGTTPVVQLRHQALITYGPFNLGALSLSTGETLWSSSSAGEYLAFAPVFDLEGTILTYSNHATEGETSSFCHCLIFLLCSPLPTQGCPSPTLLDTRRTAPSGGLWAFLG